MHLFGYGQGTVRPQGMKCEKCGGGLVSVRGRRSVILRCTECGEQYGPKDMARLIDDSFEEDMAFVPMDKL